MTNPSKRKGTAWESLGCKYLNGILEYSHPADWRLIKRAAQTGAADVGDAHAFPFILEFKDVKSPAVPTWLRQADVESVNAGFPYGIVLHKTRGKGPALARAIMSSGTFWQLINDYDLSGAPVPEPNSRGYVVWTLAEFAEVIRCVRAQMEAPA